jgi:hypothetical protein
MTLDSLKEFWKKNRILCTVLFISTIFFLLQHRFYLGWDFAAYAINARYFFYGGDYFEVYRAPMISMVMGILMLFGPLAEYLYLVLVSVLFFYSTLVFSDACFDKYLNKFNISKEQTRVLFYLLLMTPFLLTFGLMEGTELLGLAFIQLFLSYLITGKLSGHFLGFAFLSRYNFLTFGIFLLFERDYKRILKNIGLFILTTIPWFIYNFIKWGNPLTSLVDSFYLNVFARQDLIEPFKFSSLLYPINYLLPLFFVGLFAFFYFKCWKRRVPLIMSGVILILLWEIYTIPFKITRYLFNLALPVAFFSFIGICFFNKKFNKFGKILLIILFLLFLVSTSCISYRHYLERNSGKIFEDSANAIIDGGFGECKVLSNYWVPINYYSGNVFFLGDIDEAIAQNQTVLILRGYTTTDDHFSMESLEDYNVLLNESRFFLIGKEYLNNETCSKRSGWDYPMLSNPCEVFSTRFKILRLDKIVNKLCWAISK